ncbi:LPS translocon maturation chaperone LptM [Pseudohoeflea coraliihabitans]|uniref:Argininosuccinate lyase n=1 Tax=Pseudohoeflea coraliihabitans TaxID=2860393 RepID=A0ABS6WKN7_9HYPH|nr:lipoprotein [Pseudohoeflea sp. DP4N28-3]MBW3096516.1 hypothetical protein [Pseudohoeflea sp. DP4N28-3]
MTTRRLTTSLTLLLVAGLALSACGRRGDPITPSAARAEAAGNAERPAEERYEAPDRRFILDGLLD